MPEICSYPGCSEPHDNWPDGTTDGHLCQDHWEAKCSREYWLAVQGMLPWLWALKRGSQEPGDG
jgi:hypothetical protein